MKKTRFFTTLALLGVTTTGAACTAERVAGPQAGSQLQSAQAVVSGQVPLLFVVDGVRLPTNQVPSLTPAQIAGVKVLKGHAALEEFGPDASYGVVLITTKQAAPRT